MKIAELQKILESQPSTSGSTFLVSALYAISWILMIGLFVLSLGLFLESFLHYKIFLDWVSRQLNFVLNDEQRWTIATSFGFISLFLSIVFLGVVYLCKMILKRNHYMIQLEDWIYQNLSEIHKPKRKTSKR